MMIHTLGKFTEMNVDTHELLKTGRDNNYDIICIDLFIYYYIYI